MLPIHSLTSRLSSLPLLLIIFTALLSSPVLWPTQASAADFIYNTGGEENCAPITAGAAGAWGDCFVASLVNDSPHELHLGKLSFPCSGPPSGEQGWVVWLENLGDGLASATFSGPFTPSDPAEASFPPLVYTRIDISGEGIVIPPGVRFYFGYEVTGHGGQIAYNGVETWSWYLSAWDSDANWGRTAIIQIEGDYNNTSVEESSFSRIKSIY